MPKKRQQKAHAFVGREDGEELDIIAFAASFQNYPLLPNRSFPVCHCHAPFRLLRAQIATEASGIGTTSSATGSTTGRPTALGGHSASQSVHIQCQNGDKEAAKGGLPSPMDGVFRARLGKKGGRKTLFTFFRSSLAIREPLWHGALALCDPLVCAVCLLASCRAEIPAILRAKGRWDDANGRLECFGPDNGEN